MSLFKARTSRVEQIEAVAICLQVTQQAKDRSDCGAMYESLAAGAGEGNLNPTYRLQPTGTYFC